jgi:CBS domain containing-hemolysin-like protein
VARSLEENLAVVRKNMHTRFPLCQRDMGSVIGIVHMKDVWPVLFSESSNSAFEKCARPALYVDPSIHQDQLLKLFQTQRAHMAIVKDHEGRANIGILTMEDVLERLVGDIRDEHGN